MKIFDRILLIVYSLLIMVFSICVLVVVNYKLVNVMDILLQIDSDPVLRFTIVGIAIAFLLISVRMFAASLRRGKSLVPASIKQMTAHGEIRISIETIENLALRAAAMTRSAKDLHAQINMSDDGLKIAIKSLISGEEPIPAMSEEIQKNVGCKVEEETGIPVTEVSVFIANLVPSSQPFKSRVG